jgi:hypothetical protein
LNLNSEKPGFKPLLFHKLNLCRYTSGSAVVVSAGYADVALGTDTAGSVRVGLVTVFA